MQPDNGAQAAWVAGGPPGAEAGVAHGELADEDGELGSSGSAMVSMRSDAQRRDDRADVMGRVGVLG